MGYQESTSPVIVKILVAERLPPDYPASLPRTFLQRYPVIYEEQRYMNSAALHGAMGFMLRRNPVSRIIEGARFRRDGAVSLSEPRDNVSRTLGGLLQDSQGGHIYMVTCGHVAGREGNALFARGRWSDRRVGDVRLTRMPALNAYNDQCDPDSTPGRSVDCGLARLLAPVSVLRACGNVTVVNTIAMPGQMRPNDIVRFVGKESRLVNAKIGSLAVWKQIRFPDGWRCFRRLIELQPEEYRYIEGHLARPGDSGVLGGGQSRCCDPMGRHGGRFGRIESLCLFRGCGGGAVQCRVGAADDGPTGAMAGIEVRGKGTKDEIFYENRYHSIRLLNTCLLWRRPADKTNSHLVPHFLTKTATIKNGSTERDDEFTFVLSSA